MYNEKQLIGYFYNYFDGLHKQKNLEYFPTCIMFFKKKTCIMYFIILKQMVQTILKIRKTGQYIIWYSKDGRLGSRECHYLFLLHYKLNK